jgi:NADPH:quinone reductase-like Zn-dependent oxidoreductase
LPYKKQQQMKAAVIYGKDQLPEYVDYPEPAAPQPGELLATVRAVAIKHFDKSRASGVHYSADKPKGPGRIIGGDGVCILPDGKRVYAIGVSGMLAERALIDAERMVVVPEGLDDSTAAALPNAVIGSAMALRFKAQLQPGDVVLINGATGFTGRVAVQIAKHYGAGKIIATGRNLASLQALKESGADVCIPIDGDEVAFSALIREQHAIQAIDVVLDYLWGATAALILDCLKGDGSFSNKQRFVSIGSMSGDLLPLSAAILRSVNLQLSGSGLGAWTQTEVAILFQDILPEMFALTATGKLVAPTISIALPDIAQLWHYETSGGQRLVVHV